VKHLYLIVVLFAFGWLSAQTLTWTNPSFEGPAPGSSISPPGWPGCQGSPDTQPGCWSVTVPAAQGSSYIGLVYLLSIPTSQESAGQLLPTPMVGGNTYAMSLRLINLDNYNGSWNGGAVVSIYGGSTACNFQQQLWTSGNFVNSTWQTFNAILTPTSSWSYFILRVEPGVGTTWPGVGIDNMLAIVLPLKLEHFGAELVDGATQIDWQTSEEQNMESYTVQRAGTNMNFEDLETIAATGNGGAQQQYRYLDETLPEGLSYYRLRMNDQNGSTTLSEVRQVLYSKTGENLAIKRIFPNPADLAARLTIVSLVDQQAQVRIVDMAGRVVHEEMQALSVGDNELLLTTTTWRAGLYRVQVLAQGTVITQSLVVAH
jgi:Secretion system C-terminal sorting domain